MVVTQIYTCGKIHRTVHQNNSILMFYLFTYLFLKCKKEKQLRELGTEATLTSGLGWFGSMFPRIPSSVRFQVGVG